MFKVGDIVVMNDIPNNKLHYEDYKHMTLRVVAVNRSDEDTYIVVVDINNSNNKFVWCQWIIKLQTPKIYKDYRPTWF